jgi:hypothetical protein
VNKWQTIKPVKHGLWIQSLQNLHLLYLLESPVWVGTPVVRLSCCAANAHSVWIYCIYIRRCFISTEPKGFYAKSDLFAII